MLVIEVISHLSRVMSLSLRLFGNVFGEELVIIILFSIIPFLIPLPMMFLGLITGGLQAFIFVLLSIIYLQGAVAVEHEHDEQGDEAIKKLRQATEFDPSNAPAYYMLGEIYRSRKDVRQATDALKRVIALNPRMTSVHLQLAELSLETGDPNGAVSFAESAVNAMPGNVTARLTLIRALVERGDVALAVPELERLKRLHPKSPAVLTDRAEQIMSALGYASPPGDTASGLFVDREYIFSLLRDQSPKRWDALTSGHPPAVQFWYRTSPNEMLPMVPNTVRQFDPPGHVRTPSYIRGKTGIIERVLEAFPNPEERAYGRSGEPKQVLYRVRFLQRDVWQGYVGAATDTIDVEIYQHWLEPAARVMLAAVPLKRMPPTVLAASTVTVMPLEAVPAKVTVAPALGSEPPSQFAPVLQLPLAAEVQVGLPTAPITRSMPTRLKVPVLPLRSLDHSSGTDSSSVPW